jgi:hypothetical protein
MALQSEKGILYDLLVSQEWPETIHITVGIIIQYYTHFNYLFWLRNLS